MRKKIIDRFVQGIRRRILSTPGIRSRFVFAYDGKRFVRYSGCFHWRRREALRAAVIMAYHVLEKGLTMPYRRLDFGHEAVRDLMFKVNLFEHKFDSSDAQVRYARGVVRAYYELHVRNHFNMSREAVFWDEIRTFLNQMNVEASNQFHFTREAFFSNRNASFEEFARSRHTVRHFSGAIDEGVLKQAVELAMTAPSACNRQHVRVHCVTKPELKRKIFSLQGGNRGFAEYGDRLLIVTTDLEDIRWAEERNDAYTNAGIFIMNLIYSLHYYGIGSCILNWSVTKRDDLRLRKLLELPNPESVAALVICGIPPQEFDVAASPRKNLDEILTFHE